MAELLDVVELLVDLPNSNSVKGYHGTIVECYPDNYYEVEFCDSDGNTLDLLTLSANQFMVVWRVATQQWVSEEEQAIMRQTYQLRDKAVHLASTVTTRTDDHVVDQVIELEQMAHELQKLLVQLQLKPHQVMA